MKTAIIIMPGILFLYNVFGWIWIYRTDKRNKRRKFYAIAFFLVFITSQAEAVDIIFEGCGLPPSKTVQVRVTDITDPSSPVLMQDWTSTGVVERVAVNKSCYRYLYAGTQGQDYECILQANTTPVKEVADRWYAWQSNVDAAVSSRSTLTAQQVWEYATRTLTASGGLTAQQVWEYATRELTGKTGFELISAYDAAKAAASQTSVNAIPTTPLLTNDARLDNLDAAVSSRSTLTAQQVWEYVTRTLTAGSGISAQDVWEYATRELTGKTGFELTSDYDAAKTAASQISVDSILYATNALLSLSTVLEVNPLQGFRAIFTTTIGAVTAVYLISGDAAILLAETDYTITHETLNGELYYIFELVNNTLITAAMKGNYLELRIYADGPFGGPQPPIIIPLRVVSNSPTLAEIEASTVLAKEATLNTISANLLRGLGLMMENHVEDNIVRNTQGLKTSSKFYLYDSKAHATTHDKVTGVSATYTVSVTYNGSGQVTLFKVVKD